MILEPKEIKSHCFHFFSIYLLWSDGTACHDLVFWTLSFKPAFSLSSFTFIKRLCSSSSHSTIRVVSSEYWNTQMKLVVKSPPANVEDIREMGSISGSPEETHGNPFQYSCLENPMDREDWWAIVYGVTKSQTQLKWLSSIHLHIWGCLYFSQRSWFQLVFNLA